jgi:hypothetical protein
VQALVREYPSEHQIAHLQSPCSNMAALVVAKSLLVPRSMKHCLAPSFFKLEEAIFDEVLLMNLVEGEHPW